MNFATYFVTRGTIGGWESKDLVFQIHVCSLNIEEIRVICGDGVVCGRVIGKSNSFKFNLSSASGAGCFGKWGNPEACSHIEPSVFSRIAN